MDSSSSPDNSPVFFTGLANSKVENKRSHSISSPNKTTNYGISSPKNEKQPPLSSPNIFSVSKLFLKETLEKVKALSNAAEQMPQGKKRKADAQETSDVSNSTMKNILGSSDIITTPKRKLDDLKWESSLKSRNNSKADASPYPKRRVVCSPGGRHSNHSTPKIEHFHLNKDTSYEDFETPNRYKQLSGQIWKVFHENKQTEEAFRFKMMLRDKLHEILLDLYPSCGLYVVGSSMTGLGAKRSDIDMCLMLTDFEIDQSREAIDILKNVRRFFRKVNFLRQVIVIPAKVPILKFYDSVSHHEVDLNINNATGIRNTHMLSSYARIDGRVPPLVVVVKLWARSYDINDAKNNSLSSYSLVLMVIHFLQYRCKPPVLPCIQELEPHKYNPHNDVRELKLCEDLPSFISENTQDLGELFLGFLQYFASEFNFEKSAMSVRLGTVIPREHALQHAMQIRSPQNKEAHWKLNTFICIEEPFDLTNTARSVFNENVFHRIKAAFEKSWCDLKRTKNLFSVLK